jgi:hypothetical protein
MPSLEKVYHQGGVTDDRVDFDALPVCNKQVEKLVQSELAAGGGEIARKLALSILGNSSKNYYESPLDSETKHVLLESADVLSRYIDTLKAHLEMMETAQTRLSAVLNFHSKQTKKT